MRVVIVVCKSRVQGHSAFAAEEFKASSTRLVRSMKSCTESCSGRLLKIGSALSGFPFSRIGDMELRSVLRRWLNVVLTICLNNC